MQEVQKHLPSISIHAPRTGSDVPVPRRRPARRQISIHAPRTGSDMTEFLSAPRDREISIHAPRTGSDITSRGIMPLQSPFQSTLPARGATRI